jgi:ABC-type branched-subunit amino acid transport system substrate-binding protein
MKRVRLSVVIGLAFMFLFVPVLAGFAAEPVKVLKIGSTVSMKTKEGMQTKKWLELISERQNNAGGLTVKGQRYNVQMIIYDDDLSVDGGRAAAERLVYQDKVKYIICQFNSPPIIGALTVTQPNKVIQISDGMTEKTMEPQYGYYYRAPSMFWNNAQRAYFVEHYRKQGLPMTTVLINPDDVTGRGGAEKYTNTYKNLGVKVLDTLYYKRDTTDYTPFATKIKSLNPGFVDTGTTNAGAPTLLLAKALYEVGFKGGKIFNNMMETWKEIIEKVGPEAIEGAVGGFKDPRQYRKEKWVLDLCDAYEKKYGVWETDAVNWVAGWFVLTTAIKKADSLEVEDLTKALHGLEVSALDARHRFAARPDKNNPRTCDAITETMPGVVKNGKFQIVKVLSIDESYALTIKSYGLEEVYKLKK